MKSRASTTTMLIVASLAVSSTAPAIAQQKPDSVTEFAARQSADGRVTHELSVGTRMSLSTGYAIAGTGLLFLDNPPHPSSVALVSSAVATGIGVPLVLALTSSRHEEELTAALTSAASARDLLNRNERRAKASRLIAGIGEVPIGVVYGGVSVAEFTSRDSVPAVGWFFASAAAVYAADALWNLLVLSEPERIARRYDRLMTAPP